jgi:hypothetical protein
MKKITHILLLVSTLLFVTTSSVAEPYLEASVAACEHIKNCAKQKMQDIPPQFREMVEKSLASMCQGLPSADSIPGFGPGHKVYAPAMACMKSISALSCSVINESGASTPECETLGNMN